MHLIIKLKHRGSDLFAISIYLQGSTENSSRISIEIDVSWTYEFSLFARNTLPGMTRELFRYPKSGQLFAMVANVGEFSLVGYWQTV